MKEIKLNKLFKKRKVDQLFRNEIPQEDENIISDFDLNKDDISQIEKLNIYYRGKEDFPFVKGNWIIDIYIEDGPIVCIKLPIDMTYDQVNRFCEPLIEKLKCRE